jgi:hypothetical protein
MEPLPDVMQPGTMPYEQQDLLSPPATTWPVAMRRHWRLGMPLSAATLHLRQHLNLLPAVKRRPKRLPQTILRTFMVLQPLPLS